MENPFKSLALTPEISRRKSERIMPRNLVDAKDWEDLVRLLEKEAAEKGGIKGSKFYSTDELKNTIQEFKAGRLTIAAVTAAGGLRRTVQRLMDEGGKRTTERSGSKKESIPLEKSDRRSGNFFVRLKKRVLGKNKKEETEEEREIDPRLIKEAREKRNELLDGRGDFLMSKSDFHRYFSSNSGLGAVMLQENVGDCYLIAAIHAMSCSPNFEMIVRSSMRRSSDGSWQVRMPLMDEKGEIVTITQEDLSPQERQSDPVDSAGRQQRLDRQLRPVRGKEGLQVLETAYAKIAYSSKHAELGRFNRSVLDAGGSPGAALRRLGGENFRQFDIGGPYKATKLAELNESDMADLDYFLDNFDPEVYIATATAMLFSSKAGKFYRIEGSDKFLMPKHAYSIVAVDKEKKTIKVANPWGTSQLIELTFDEFKKGFAFLSVARVNNAKLLKNINRIENKAA